MKICCRNSLKLSTDSWVLCPNCKTAWYNYHGEWIAINKPLDANAWESQPYSFSHFANAHDAEKIKKVRPIYYKALCEGCGHCIKLCPHKAIKRISNNLTLDTMRCVNCRKCVALCPSGALK